MRFLADILERKKDEVRALRAARERDPRRPIAPSSQSLANALAANVGVAIIGEIKRASPSVGSIRADLDVEARASLYQSAGAAAISVLTDGPGFGGSFDDLRRIRARVTVPLLCKDFVVDEIQIDEARIHGADAILLIVAALPDQRLSELLAHARSLGMEALVETHDEIELRRALALGARIVGVNNRDLRSFTVDLETSARLLPLLPSHVIGVSESGVRTVADARRLRDGGARALLVGEALVRADDPVALLTAMRGDRA